MVLLGAAAGNSLSPTSTVPCSAQHDTGICLYPIYTQLTYTMIALFVELPPFERHRAEYLDDEAFRALQVMLMQHPEAGDVIQGTGGLRKVRFADERRHKGKNTSTDKNRYHEQEYLRKAKTTDDTVFNSCNLCWYDGHFHAALSSSLLLRVTFGLGALFGIAVCVISAVPFLFSKLTLCILPVRTAFDSTPLIMRVFFAVSVFELIALEAARPLPVM